MCSEKVECLKGSWMIFNVNIKGNLYLKIVLEIL